MLQGAKPFGLVLVFATALTTQAHGSRVSGCEDSFSSGIADAKTQQALGILLEASGSQRLARLRGACDEDILQVISPGLAFTQIYLDLCRHNLMPGPKQMLELLQDAHQRFPEPFDGRLGYSPNPWSIVEDRLAFPASGRPSPKVVAQINSEIPLVYTTVDGRVLPMTEADPMFSNRNFTHLGDRPSTSIDPGFALRLLNHGYIIDQPYFDVFDPVQFFAQTVPLLASGTTPDQTQISGFKTAIDYLTTHPQTSGAQPINRQHLSQVLWEKRPNDAFLSNGEFSSPVSAIDPHTLLIMPVSKLRQEGSKWILPGDIQVSWNRQEGGAIPESGSAIFIGIEGRRDLFFVGFGSKKPAEKASARLKATKFSSDMSEAECRQGLGEIIQNEFLSKGQIPTALQVMRLDPSAGPAAEYLKRLNKIGNDKLFDDWVGKFSERRAPKETLFDTFGRYLQEEFGIDNRSELTQILAQNRITPLLRLADRTPKVFLESLKLWRKLWPEDRHLDVLSEFAKSRAHHQKIDQPPGSRHGVSDSRILVQSHQQGVPEGKIPQSDLQMEYLTDLVARLFRADFENDMDATIAEVRQEESRLTAENFPNLHEELLRQYRLLYQTVADRFQATQDRGRMHLKTPLFPYQVEGSWFMIDHGRVINADDTGLGKSIQAIAAFEHLISASQAKRLLWVTTKSNVSPLIAEQILRHSGRPEMDVVKIVGGQSSADRDLALRRAAWGDFAGDAPYVVTTYETLVALNKKDPEKFTKWSARFDVVVADEGHKIDNEYSLRSEAVRAFKAPYVWLLTATPYQSNRNQIFILLNFLRPDRFPTPQKFEQDYPPTLGGSLRLRQDTADILIRRNVEEICTILEDPEVSGVSLADQLNTPGPKIPAAHVGEPIYWTASKEQVLETVALLNNPTEWARRHRLQPANALKAVNFYQTAILYTPEHLGLKTSNQDALFPAISNAIQGSIAQGKKVTLWFQNTEPLENGLAFFAAHQPLRFDGSVDATAREQRVQLFTESLDHSLLFINQQSGGEGLDLKGGDETVFVQLPRSYPSTRQVLGRIRRVLSRDDAAKARWWTSHRMTVARFADADLEGLPEDMKAVLQKHGSIDQQRLTRLSEAEFLYEALMSGQLGDQEFESAINAEMVRGVEKRTAQ